MEFEVVTGGEFETQHDPVYYFPIYLQHSNELVILYYIIKTEPLKYFMAVWTNSKRKAVWPSPMKTWMGAPEGERSSRVGQQVTPTT